MSRDLIGMRIAILAADGVERIELEEPRGALYGAGALSDVLLWTDLRNAGAEVVDTEVVVDGQFTTSRSPDDLRAFCPAIVEQFAARRVAH